MPGLDKEQIVITIVNWMIERQQWIASRIAENSRQITNPDVKSLEPTLTFVTEILPPAIAEVIDQNNQLMLEHFEKLLAAKLEQTEK